MVYFNISDLLKLALTYAFFKHTDYSNSIPPGLGQTCRDYYQASRMKGKRPATIVCIQQDYSELFLLRLAD